MGTDPLTLMGLLDAVAADRDHFESLVVPLDLTPRSDRALETVQALIRRRELPVHLVTTTSRGLDALDDDAELAQRRASIDAPHVEVHNLHTNDAADAIAELHGELAHPLLCLAAHGRTAVGDLVLGSFTDELLRHHVGPALVVGPTCDPAIVPGKLVVALAPDTPLVRLVAAGRAWQQTFGGTLEAVEVVEPSQQPTPRTPELEQVARWLGAPLRTIASHDPAQALIECTIDEGAMIVVTTHARDRLRSLVLGSVTRELVQRSATPVLVATPAGDEYVAHG